MRRATNDRELSSTMHSCTARSTIQDFSKIADFEELEETKCTKARQSGGSKGMRKMRKDAGNASDLVLAAVQGAR